MDGDLDSILDSRSKEMKADLPIAKDSSFDIDQITRCGESEKLGGNL